jgi:hypothetical protein
MGGHRASLTSLALSDKFTVLPYLTTSVLPSAQVIAVHHQVERSRRRHTHCCVKPTRHRLP